MTSIKKNLTRLSFVFGMTSLPVLVGGGANLIGQQMDGRELLGYSKQAKAEMVELVNSQQMIRQNNLARIKNYSAKAFAERFNKDKTERQISEISAYPAGIEWTEVYNAAEKQKWASLGTGIGAIFGIGLAMYRTRRREGQGPESPVSPTGSSNIYRIK